VRLIYKDFPLPSHALAMPAHEAARCAGEQGRYWAYHDVLFERQPRFERDDLVAYAINLNLDRERFERCLDGHKMRVARGADIPAGRGCLVEAGPLTLAVFNGGSGRFYAVSALCPHEEGPLADGWIEGDAVVCPWHGFDFDLATGQCRVAEDLSIGVFATRVVNGMVEVDVP